MAKTAEELLNELERRELIPGDVVAALRAQVAKSAKPVTANGIVRKLMERGDITSAQAQNLLGDSRPALPATSPPSPRTPAVAQRPSLVAEELGLASLDDEPAAAPPSPARPTDKMPPKPASAPEDLGLASLDDDSTVKTAPTVPAATPAKSTANSPVAKPTAKPTPKPTASKSSATELKPFANSMDLLFSDEGLSHLPTHQPSPASPSAQPLAPPPAAKPNPPAAKPHPPVAAPKSAPPPSPALVELATLTEADILGGVGLDPLTPASGLTALGPASRGAGPHHGAQAAAGPASQPAVAGDNGKSRVIWLVLCGVALVLVAVAAIVIVFLLIPRGNPGLEFEAAENLYAEKQYAPAIEKYNVLLKLSPRFPQASMARVHRGMSKILAANSGTTRDWPALLPVVKQSLAEIRQEPDLQKVHQELAPLVTEMTVGLAELAKQGQTAEEVKSRIGAAWEALAIADDARFVPGALREWQRLSDVRDTLLSLTRDVERAPALAAALLAMQQGIDARKTGDAFAARDALLRAYPELASDAKLIDLCKQTAQADAANVTTTELATNGQTAEAKSAIQAQVAFAIRAGSPAPVKAGTPVFAVAGGAIWALEAENGSLTWQRAIGGAGAGSPPFSTDSEGGLLLVDALHQELVRVDSLSGALRWRHAFDGPIAAAPLVIGSRVIAAGRSGQIRLMDGQTGDGQVAAQLPQTVRVAPVADPSGGHLYQLADHSQLYVLSAKDLKCTGAAYLGHAAGSVVAPPVLLPKHLVIAENRGPHSARLRVVALAAEGQVSVLDQQLDIPATVSSAPLIVGGQLVVLTDGGPTLVFSYSADANEPLSKSGAFKSEQSTALIRHGRVMGGSFWVADAGLRLFDLQGGGAEIKEKWAGCAGGVFDAPPQINGNILFGQRRELGRRGVTAFALRAGDHAPLWETQLAAPLLTPIFDETGQSATVASTAGAFFKLDLGKFSGAMVQEAPPVGGPKSLGAFTASVALPGGGQLLAPLERAGELRISDPGEKPARQTPPPGTLAGEPLAWSGGVLVPCASGAIYWIDVSTGAPRTGPFQLPIQVGERLKYCSLAAAGEGNKELIVSAGRRSILRLGLKPDPAEHLVELAAVQLEFPLASPIASLGNAVFLVDQSQTLRSFELPDLKPGPTVSLATAKVVFGPRRVGQMVLVATDREELLGFDATAKQIWKIALEHGPLAGGPAAAGDHFLLAHQGGVVRRITSDSGLEVGKLDLAQPLQGQPAVHGDACYVTTAAGSLLKVLPPTKEAPSP